MNAAAVTRHRLGFAVKVLSDGGLPSHDTRRWTSGPHLRHSLERLRECADELAQIGLLARGRGIPLSSHPGQFTS